MFSEGKSVMDWQHKKRLNSFLSLNEDGSFYVGHASVLVRLSGKLFLIDPVFSRPLFLESWIFFPELAIDLDLLTKIDGVLISHSHEDHYDMALLRSLPKSLPIYITKGRVGFDELLSDKSLNVIPLQPFEKNLIFGDISVYPIPSDHNDIDSSFVIQNKSFGVFQGNDNFLGESVVQRVASVVGKIDHSYVPFAYVWWYPYCLTSLSEDQRRTESLRLSHKNMAIGAMMGRLFGSDVIIPSAANLSFYDNSESAINREIATPFDYLDYVRENHRDLVSKTFALFSGDYALKLGQENKVYSAGLTKAEFFNKLDVFLQKRNESIPPAPVRVDLQSDEIRAVQRRFTGKQLPKFDRRLFFRRADLPGWALEVSMQDYSSKITQEGMKSPGSITFDIQPHAFEMWLEDRITLETILNSQRFLTYRNPEVFEQDVWNVLRTNF